MTNIYPHDFTKSPIFFASALISSSSLAATSLDNTRVLQVAQNRSIGDFVFIRIQGTPNGTTSCAGNATWSYTLPLTTAADRALYSSLLSAVVSGATVHISGSGLCSEYSNVESVQSFHILAL